MSPTKPALTKDTMRIIEAVGDASVPIDVEVLYIRKTRKVLLRVSCEIDDEVDEVSLTPVAARELAAALIDAAEMVERR